MMINVPLQSSVNHSFKHLAYTTQKCDWAELTEGRWRLSGFIKAVTSAVFHSYEIIPVVHNLLKNQEASLKL